MRKFMLVAILAASPLIAWGQSFRDGTYLVGTDIPPGVYRAPGGAICYWERLSGLSGEMDDVLANDISEHSRQIVEIKATDKAFKTSGCGTWELADGGSGNGRYSVTSVAMIAGAIIQAVMYAVEPDAALIDRIEAEALELVTGTADLMDEVSHGDERDALEVIDFIFQGMREALNNHE